MDAPIFLSIIIPCYNVASFVPKTIESLRQLQDAEDVEFIFINDGSTDSTLSIINDFAAQDVRSIVINQHNQGVSSARNAALAIAHGEYLLCLDGDDYLEPNTLSIIRTYSPNCDALITPLYFVKEKSRKLYALNSKEGLYSTDQYFSAISFFQTAPMLVYRTDIIKQHHLLFQTSIKAGEVIDFTFSFLAHAQTIQVVDYAFYNYVMRASSAMHAPNCTADMTSLLLLEHVKQIHTSWAQTPTCWFTTYKVINAFTYNKYLRTHLATKDILDTIHTLLHTPSYRELLHRVVRQSSTPVLHRLLIVYQLIMPSRMGYRIINTFNRFIPIVR